MRCPVCGDATEQQRVASEAGSLTYRCGKCGQFYPVPNMDLAATINHLEELKANADRLASQLALLVELITEVEAHINLARNGKEKRA